jgi:hypothetical protein
MRGGKRRGACDACVVVGRRERGGGGKEKRVRARRLAPFEAEAGEGWGFGLRCRVEEKMGQIDRGRGSATWTDMARTRWLRAALTAVGGARLAGAPAIGEDGGVRRRGREQLIGGAGRRRARWAAARCERERRK